MGVATRGLQRDRHRARRRSLRGERERGCGRRDRGDRRSVAQHERRARVRPRPGAQHLCGESRAALTEGDPRLQILADRYCPSQAYVLCRGAQRRLELGGCECRGYIRRGRQQQRTGDSRRDHRLENREAFLAS